MATWRKGTAQLVRDLCKRLGTFQKADLKDETWDAYMPWSRVGSVLKDFLASGEVRVVQKGKAGKRPGIDKSSTVYEYVGPKLRGFGVREKVFRAMHVKGLFSVRDVTVLSDAEHSYVCALVRKLIESGDIEAAGRAPGPRRPEAAYRVRNRDEFFLRYVNVSRRDAGAQG